MRRARSALLLCLLLLARGASGQDLSRASRPLAELKAALSTERWQSRVQFRPTTSLGPGLRRLLEGGGLSVRCLGRVICVQQVRPVTRDGEPGLEVRQFFKLRPADEAAGQPVAGKAGSGAACEAYSEAISRIARGFALRKVDVGDLHVAALEGLLREAPRDSVEGYRLAIKHAAASVGDKYTRYIGPEDWRKDQSEGKGSGVGILMEHKDGAVRVVRTFRGAPAYGKLRAGDRIEAVDGHPVSSLEEAARLVRGALGSSVRLTVSRGTSRQELTLSRREYTVDPVDSHLAEGGIGVLRLSEFIEGSRSAVLRAIMDLKQQHGGRLNGIVLDLRGNPGGLIAEARGVLNLFVSSGRLFRWDEPSRPSGDVGVVGALATFIFSKGRVTPWQAAASSSTKRAHWWSAPYTTQPMVVLVDKHSASSAEIVAGTLKNLGRAVLLGERTFGKGIGQTYRELPDGSGLAVTTARIWLPAGPGRGAGEVAYHGEGIAPHVSVVDPRPSSETGRDVALETALARLRGRPAGAEEAR